MLFAGESYTGAMHRVAAHDVKDFCIFFRGGAEGSLAGGDIIKEIFDLDDSQTGL